MDPQLIIYSTTEDEGFPGVLDSRIRSEKPADEARILLSYPTVYIHYWPGAVTTYLDKRGNTHSIQKYNVYVGESNDIVNRTKEHYANSESQKNWQYHLTHDGKTPNLIVVGHGHFNKSFTLDIENKLIEYMMASPKSVEILHNGRGNPQNEYYPVKEFEETFHNIWKGLRKFNRELFRSETEIEHSALFKASPLKKLKEEQIDAKETILSKIYDAVENGQEGQLIIVQGEAGTGKTVLNASLFYDLVTNGKDYFGRDLDCHLMVNHRQQISVYEQMAERLDLGSDVVHKPTSFINSHNPDHKVDVSFIDEGHLLLTQGKQSYRGKNQLSDIMARSKVTVLMFDEYQVLTSEQYWEPEILEKFKEISHKQGNYIALSQQLRMNCSLSTTGWINDFVLNRRISRFIPDDKYEVRSFDTPQALQDAIKEKAGAEETRLSRLVASYDWEYSNIHRPENREYWGVRIGNWFLPWNYETLDENLEGLPNSKIREINHQAWAEQSHTIDEVGSTFTIQGFDLSYVGVILGPSVRYIDGNIVFDPTKSHNEKAKHKRTLSNNTKKSFGETFIRNEIKVLMSRGVRGLYIYACDGALRKALKEIAKI